MPTVAELAYPASLPSPQVATIQSAERRALTGGAGPRDARPLQTDRLARQQLQFTLTSSESATFKDWIRETLTWGGAWFAATWPLPQGLIVGVRRFDMATERWLYLGGKLQLWRLTIEAEVRGRGEMPNAVIFEDSFNPLDTSDSVTLTNSNRTASGGGGFANRASATLIPRSSGQLYFEMAIDVGLHSGAYPAVGVKIDDGGVSPDIQPGDSAASWGFFHGFKFHAGAASAYGPAWATGDVVGFALDLDAGDLWISVNGVFVGDPVAGTSPAFSGVLGSLVAVASVFGTEPSVVTVALYDPHFAYTPPAGFTAWE